MPEKETSDTRSEPSTPTISTLTSEQKRLSRRYVIYRMLTNMWFIGAVWVYFFRIFISDQQLGIIESMAFTLGLLIEIPSGALADKFGRDRVVRLGQVLCGAGIITQGLSSTFTSIFFGDMIFIAGMSLASGSDDALFFSKLNFEKESKHWLQLVTKAQQFSIIASLTTTIIGGFLHTINPRIPWILTGVAFIGSALSIWTIKDERERQTSGKFSTEVKDYFNNIKTGFAQFNTPQLRLYVPFIIIVQGLFYATGFGMLRLILLDRFNYTPFSASLAVASCSIITIGLLYLLNKNNKVKDKKVKDKKKKNKSFEKNFIILIGFTTAAALMLSIPDIGLWGYVVILTLYANQYIAVSYMNNILNNHSPEDQRATVLSISSFLKALPYIALAPLIGYMSTNNTLEYFFIIFTVLTVLSVYYFLHFAKKLESSPAGNL